MRRILPAFAAGLLVLGCGSSSDSTNPGDNTVVTCTATITGGSDGIAGTYSPCAVTAIYTTSTGATAIGISFTNGVSISGSVSFPGVPASNSSHLNTSSGAQGNVTVLSSTKSSSFWRTDATTSGTYNLQLTSASNPVAGIGASAYTIHGTLDASMPPVVGSTATGTATLHVVF